jgi:hypothetical protein
MSEAQDFDTTPTYVVTQAAYDRLVEEVARLRHLPEALRMANDRAERWKRRHDLLVEAINEVQKAKAEAWDEGYNADGPIETNPYREAS